MINYKINQKEFTSLLFYQGADIRDEDFNDESLKQFYSVRNAYEGLNMLLFEGVENETVRLVSEERQVNTVLLDYIEELLDTYANLYSAMCKYTCCAVPCTYINSYRYDRQQSLSALLGDRTSSFFSTSAEKKTNDYFKRKAGLLIFEVSAQSDTIHLDVNEVLGPRSRYPEENEILYPPFSGVELEKTRMTEEELTYRDCNGNPPQGKYRVKMSNKVENLFFVRETSRRNIIKTQLLSKIKDQKLLQTAKRVWQTYNGGNEPEASDINTYIYWKQCLQKYIKIMYAEIYASFFGYPESDWNIRMKSLLPLINFKEEKADNKRREYRAQLMKQNKRLAAIRGAALFFIALTLIDLQFTMETVVKVLGIGFAAISLILYRVYKGSAVEGKVRQWTRTFLRLDELKMDIQFEQDFSEEKMESYFERYKKIILEDDMGCIDNTEQLISMADQLIQDKAENLTNMML